jgi:hypothetical protein
MNQYLFALEELGELAVLRPEVIDPDGGVNQDHYAVLLRRIGLAFFSLPPRAASRWALLRATKASNPILTSAVFSFTPVKREASFSIESSILSVVLMHIIMHILYASVKPPTGRG